MKRLMTAAVGAPIVIAALFWLPEVPFLVLILLAVLGCAVELTRLVEVKAPTGPLWLLPVIVPATAVGLYRVLAPSGGGDPRSLVIGLGLLMTIGFCVLLLWSGLELEEAPVALGFLAFGVFYFSFPAAAIAVLQQIDPWLIFLLLAIVWLGDSAAYYVGSAIGRHKMAPRISPNKSWEGAIASFGMAMLSTVVWSYFFLGTVDVALLLVAAITAVSAQLGDLLESLFKRSVHIKDSGNLLPGHGGLLDRLDALLIAAPVFFAGLWLIRWPGLAE